MNILGPGISECLFQSLWRAAIPVFRILLTIGVLLAGLHFVSSPAVGQTARFEAHDLEIRVFPDNSVEQIAICRIDSVFTEHRKIGFFRIKLLPRLVVQGVRLEFSQSNMGTNWLDGFQFDPAPGVRRSAVEWRGLTVYFPQEKSPRLRAERVYPSGDSNPAVFRLEDVTIRAGGETFNVPRAELQAAGRSGQVVWTCSNQVVQWDLFTGQCKTNSVKSNSNEKS